MQALRHWLLAVQYFTRLPVTGALAQWVGYTPAMLSRAFGHLPLVGALVGLLSALALALALALLPAVGAVPAVAWVAASLAVLGGLLVTGALHEDGLADLADGLGGGASAERALEIMKDSRIGAFGAMALVVALGLKVALLAALVQAAAVRATGQALPAVGAGEWLAAAASCASSASGWLLPCAALVGGHVLSRLPPVWIAAWLPYAGVVAASKSQSVTQGVTWPALALATGVTCGVLLALCWVAPGVPWWWPALGCAVGAAWVGWRLKVRLRGFTGDGLGAAQQVGELGFYLTLLACL
ncbi:adenosylcobinamide-GDP ribazoletransferase [Allofranklinella schreckenbergeri]|uniref:Adenosylcobinamide-GDP ribazoletransferase n=1 Tax=Allofranklinella schreckenbergeri TaxID=1076744 RepID=A0A3M6QF22_9BURK|nr:adenosylcobinamide-GDP ribazoletransferase [Allofranklinella schreckenbergeri]RMX01704.1 adenosylcobinamide-GDP ribazoletransferase [Allofranklinella schreckenbergeri]